MSDEREIFVRLSKIEQIVARIDERTSGLGDMERRLRTLEDKENRRGGILAALTTIGSAVGAALMWLAQHLSGKGGGA